MAGHDPIGIRNTAFSQFSSFRATSFQEGAEAVEGWKDGSIMAKGKNSKVGFGFRLLLDSSR